MAKEPPKRFKHKEIGNHFHVEQAQEDTKIDTAYGPATIEKGHYIATPVDEKGKPNGKPYGIAKADLPVFYEEAKD